MSRLKYDFLHIATMQLGQSDISHVNYILPQLFIIIHGCAHCVISLHDILRLNGYDRTRQHQAAAVYI